MALHNLAVMTSATAGTGTLTLGSAVSPFLSFADAGVANAERVYYSIVDNAASEVGIGTYTTAGTTLSRDTIYESTSAGAAINCTGNQIVRVTMLAETYLAALSKAPVMWHDQSIATVGNNFAVALDSAHPYGYVRYQNAAATGDTWKNGFVCQAGTYTFNCLHTKDSTRGILTAYVDDVSIGTIDLYFASIQRSQVGTIASVVLTDGYHTFKGYTNTKNASSSGYLLSITKMYFTPSAY